MDVTYLGHASYLVRVGQRNILIDPLLTDTFQAGTAAVYPPRALCVDKMPRIDAVVITHCHPGHLEIESLAKLPRTVPVFHPADPTIALVVDGLGFASRSVVAPGETIEFSGGSITATPSTSAYAEIGCYCAATDGGACWYLADTGVNPTIVRSVLDQCSTPDLLICNYPAYHHRFFTEFDLQRPHQELASALEAVLRIPSTLVAPNFNGLTYVGDAEWINRIMFPFSDEQFLQELRRVSPERQSCCLLPGDVVRVLPGRCDLLPQASDFAQAVPSPPGDLRFDLTRGIPPLRDPNPDGVAPTTFRQRTEAFLAGPLRAWIDEEVRSPASTVARYGRLGVRFRLDQVYSDGTEDAWLISLRPEGADIQPQPQGVCGGATAQFGLRIAASVLDRWVGAEVPYYYVYCYCRPWGDIYRVARCADDTVQVLRSSTRDLVSMYLSEHTERVYHPWVRKQLERYAVPV